jgi:hypothetical protein
MQRWKASPAAPSAFAPTTTAQLMCAASPNLPFLAANAACASRPDAMRTSVTRRRKSVRTQHADITRDPNLGPWAISDTAAHAARLVARTHSLRLEVFGHCRPSDRAAGRGPGARLARSVESSERVSPEGYADGAPGSGTSRVDRYRARCSPADGHLTPSPGPGRCPLLEPAATLSLPLASTTRGRQAQTDNEHDPSPIIESMRALARWRAPRPPTGPATTCSGSISAPRAAGRVRRGDHPQPARRTPRQGDDLITLLMGCPSRARHARGHAEWRASEGAVVSNGVSNRPRIPDG